MYEQGLGNWLDELNKLNAQYKKTVKQVNAIGDTVDGWIDDTGKLIETKYNNLGKQAEGWVDGAGNLIEKQLDSAGKVVEGYWDKTGKWVQTGISEIQLPTVKVETEYDVMPLVLGGVALLAVAWFMFK